MNNLQQSSAGIQQQNHFIDDAITMVPFKQISQYDTARFPTYLTVLPNSKTGYVDEVTLSKQSKRLNIKLSRTESIIEKVLANIPEAEGYSQEVIQKLKYRTGDIIERLFRAAAEEALSLPRSITVICTCCCLLALRHGKIVQVSKPYSSLITNVDGEKDFEKKVMTFLEKLETFDILKLFEHKVLTGMQAKEEQEQSFRTVCEKFEMTTKDIDKLTERYMEVVRSGIMKGKNREYVQAAVLFHCLMNHSPFKPENNNEWELKDLQEALCEKLDIKKRMLITSVHIFEKLCDSTEEAEVVKPKNKKRKSAE